MGFPGIKDIEINFLPVLVRHPIHGRNIAHENGTGDASKLNHDGLPAPETRQQNEIAHPIAKNGIQRLLPFSHTALLTFNIG
jgi:hypothetical protein